MAWVGFLVLACWNSTGLWAGEGSDGESPYPLSLPEESFRQGVSAYREGRYDEAISFFEVSLKNPAAWEEYPYFYLLKAHWEAQHFDEALGFCKAFQQRFPESPLAQKVRLIEAESYQMTSAYWLASQAYVSCLEKGESAEARVRYGEVLERLERFSEAHANYQTIRRTWPRSPEARTARTRAWKIADEHPESIESNPKAIYLREESDLCVQEGAFADALSFCRALEGLPLPREERRRVLLNQILAFTGMGQTDTAHGVLRLLMVEDPGSKEVPEGLLVVGRDYWRRDRNQEASPVLTQLLEEYTDTEEAMKAAYILARIHFEGGELKKAIRQFRETRFLYPDTEWEDEAAWGEAWCYYLLGRYVACAEHLSGCLSQEVWDAGVPRALYWQGRCLERAGRVDEGRRVYEKTRTEHPDSFYSVLAEWRLSGEPLESVIVSQEDSSAGPAMEVEAPKAVQKLSDAALPLLLETGLLEEAVERLDWLRKGPEAGKLTARDWVEAYCQAGDHLQALRMAQSEGLLSPLVVEAVLGLNPEAQRFLHMLYPLPSRYDIQGKAHERGLDPFLVAGLIHQESVFMPDAVSPAGAVGLMQIMPATGRRVAEQMGLEDFRVELLREPEVNLQIGTAYLESLASRYDADWSKVLAAYNAGPGAVANWAEGMPFAETDEFIEGIRYRETRIYVKKVLYNWSLYHKIYGSPSVKEASSEACSTPEEPAGCPACPSICPLALNGRTLVTGTLNLLTAPAGWAAVAD